MIPTVSSRKTNAAYNTSLDPSPTILPHAPSDRDKFMITEMFRKEFSFPPAQPRKPARKRKRKKFRA